MVKTDFYCFPLVFLRLWFSFLGREKKIVWPGEGVSRKGVKEGQAGTKKKKSISFTHTCGM